MKTDIASRLETALAEFAGRYVPEIAWPVRYGLQVTDVREEGHRFNLTTTLLAGENYMCDDLDDMFPLIHGDFAAFREICGRHGLNLPGPIVIQRPVWRVEAGARDMQPRRSYVSPAESIPYVMHLSPIDELADGRRPQEEYAEILRTEPNNLRARLGRAESGRRRAKAREPLSETLAADFRSVLELDPWNELAHLWLKSALHRKAGMKSTLSQLRAERADPLRWIDLGWTIPRSHPQIADACFRRAVSLAPGDPFIEGTRAYHALQFGLGQALTDACEHVLRRDATVPWARHFRGVGRTETGDLRGALEDFNNELEIDAGNLDARFRRALTLGRADRFDEALADLETVAGKTACRFTWEEVCTTRVWILERAEKFDEAIRLCHGMGPATYPRGAISRILKKQGRFRDARQVLSMETRNNLHVSVAIELAEVCLLLGDIKGGESASAMAIERSQARWAKPGDRANAHLCRARVLAAAGRNAEALEDLRTALRLNPQDPGVLELRRFLENA